MTASGRMLHSLRRDLGRADRRAGIVDARVGKGDHEALRHRQHRKDRRQAARRPSVNVVGASDRRLPGGIEDDDRRTGLDRGNRHARSTRSAVASSARNRTTPTFGPEHLHRTMPKLPAFEREAREAGQFGQAERNRLRHSLQRRPDVTTADTSESGDCSVDIRRALRMPSTASAAPDRRRARRASQDAGRN